jgi:hypothetical protein
LGELANNVLEIGTHRGATFFATIFRNDNINQKICVDNFSELDDGTVREELKSNIKRYGRPVTFLEQDCFNIDPNDLPGIDLYIYDGAHSLEAQEKAITHFWDALESPAIIVIDDYRWDDVYTGTMRGLEKVKANVVKKFVLIGDEWHNGLGILLIKK